MALFGPMLLVAATLAEIMLHVNSLLLWGSVWLIICRNNYVLHNHIHSPFWSNKVANRFLNIFLGLSTGMPAGNWKLMHVHGHHVDHKFNNLKSRHYLDRFIIPDNTEHTAKNYSKYVIANTVPQIFIPILELVKMAIKSPFRRPFALYYLVDYFVITLFLTFIFFLSPVSCIAIVGMYIFITLLSLRVDYYTHIGAKPVEAISFANSCRNDTYNKLFWNFGYHVGHHIKPKLHWSLLPSYEEELGILPSSADVQAKSINLFGGVIPLGGLISSVLVWNSVTIKQE